MSALEAHLKEGASHVCRAWSLTRRDGARMGFTDHDQDLTFDGLIFRADTGMSALAVQQTTGLAVDNSETMGALSASVIRGEDIAAGLYDGAEVTAWLVRWDDTSARQVQFRGDIGEIRTQGGAFSAELRGLTDRLNQSGGRVFHSLCSSVLGDAACGVDLENGTALRAVGVVTEVGDVLRLAGLDDYAAGWFAHGRLEVSNGAAAGQTAMIGSDQGTEDRRIGLVTPLSCDLRAGDDVWLIAGCDKRFATCAAKFGNTLNFRGFPHIPGEDWLISVPRRDGQNDGGALF